jgi:hypothetical protein
MRSDQQYRHRDYAYLERMNWSDYGGAYTYWADNVWQFLADQDYNQKIAQKAYDDIMSYPKTSRVLGFTKYLEN